MLDYTDLYADLYKQYGIDAETVDPLIAHFIAYADSPIEADADIVQIFKQVEADFARWDAPRSTRPRRRSSSSTRSPDHSSKRGFTP